MAYEDNLEFDSLIDTKFVRCECRINIPLTDLSVYSGTTYSTPITDGPVSTVKVNGTAYTLGSSIAGLSAGEYYYDRTAQLLYIKFSLAVSTEYIVVSVRLFFAESECLWYETPDDDTSELVLWRPLLSRAPSFKMVIPTKGLGFLPNDQTSLTLLNDGTLNYLLGNGSFRRTPIEVWHQLGERRTENFRKTLTGVFGLRVSVSTTEINFDVTDKSVDFDRLISGRNMTGVTTLDPKFNNTVCMKIIGHWQGSNAFFEMANMDYNSDSPTTSNNRKFGLIYDPDGTYSELSVAGTLRPGGGLLFQPTVAANVDKFRYQDVVWFDGAADQYFVIDSLGSGNIYFTTSPTGASNQSGNLRRSIFEVYLVKGGNKPYLLKYGRDFTQTTHVSNILGITLTSSAEANVGAATFVPDEDFIFCKPSGRNNQVTFDGNNVGDDTAYKTGDVALLQFLKEEALLTEDEIDYDSISAIAAYIDYQIFVPMPFANFSEYPSVRDVLDLILKSLLVRGYFNNEGKFTVRAYKPIATTSETFAKDSIENESYSYEIDYSDIKKIYPVQAWLTETNRSIEFTGSKDAIIAGTANTAFVENGEPAYASQASTNFKGEYLHETDVKDVFEHLVALDTGSKFANRVQDLFGDRDGLMKIRGRRLAMLREVGDKVTVSRDSMVGYDDETGLTAPMEIVEIEKSDKTTDLTLNDNKAAQDAADESYWTV